MNLPGAAPGGGAGATGGSAVSRAELTFLLLVRGRGRGLELLLDSCDVLGVLQELLEQPPLALAGRRAEGRGLVVGHVEDDRLGVQERNLGRAGDRVRVDA